MKRVLQWKCHRGIPMRQTGLHLLFRLTSGCHQKRHGKNGKPSDRWEIPYLPIDPKDVGRSYEPVIRINSQSGKGGVSFILEHNFGLVLPKPVQQEFSRLCTKVSDENHKELMPQEIFDLFDEEYVNVAEPICLRAYSEKAVDKDTVHVEVVVTVNGVEQVVAGEGNGLLDGFVNGMKQLGVQAEIVLYSQHAMTSGTEALAVSYVQIQNNGKTAIGAGISSNVSRICLCGQYQCHELVWRTRNNRSNMTSSADSARSPSPNQHSSD